MATSIDVAARLDEGQTAVDTIAEYVWACHLLGFAHSDLTGHRYQVCDWYAAEDGLDLRVLDAECSALTATAAVAEEALHLQDSQFQNLSRAWQGAGAQASTDFLTGHARAAAQAATGIRSAAATLARLRDNLWHAVDAKVTAAVQIEGRQAGQRGAWLAAARTLSTGVGDRSAASELIDTQVKPFVANDIGGEWLTAMRNTTRAVADAYREAIGVLRAEAVPMFGIPGELGPAWSPPSVSPRAVMVSAYGPVPETGGGVAMPAGFSMPPASGPIPPPTTPAGVSAAAPPLGSELISPAAAPALAPTPGMGQGLGGGGLPGLGGLSGVGTGLTGTGQQLADLLGGLIGSSADGLPDSIGDLPADDVGDIRTEAGEGPHNDVADDAEQDNVDDGSEDDGAEDTDEDEEADEDEPMDPDEAAELTELQTDSPESDSPQPASEVPAPVSPPPTVPDPVAEPLAAPSGGTPCEIAADELPQAGP